MKTVAVMQPYLFAYLGYFQLLANSDLFIVYDDVNFIKKGWIHRNRILNKSEPLLFTVPLFDPSQNRFICNTLINKTYDEWKSKFLKTLHHNYSKAPHFSAVNDLIEKVLDVGKAGNSIAWLALESIIRVAEYLKIRTKIVRTSRIYDNTNLKAQERILDICVQENATRYLNPSGGTELYDSNAFKVKNIELLFCKTKPHTYPQLGNNFVPYLSIIDVLMFNTPDQVSELLKECEISNG